MVSKLENSELTFAYLAGIIDGDGAIVALVENKRVRIEISLYNNCCDVIQFIKNVFKFGKIYKRKWAIKTNSGSKVVLNSIKKYLIVKYSQCKLALQLIEEKDMEKQKLIAVVINKFNIDARKVFSVKCIE